MILTIDQARTIRFALKKIRSTDSLTEARVTAEFIEDIFKASTRRLIVSKKTAADPSSAEEASAIQIKAAVLKAWNLEPTALNGHKPSSVDARSAMVKLMSDHGVARNTIAKLSGVHPELQKKHCVRASGFIDVKDQAFTPNFMKALDLLSSSGKGVL